MATADAGSVSAANLEAMGLHEIWRGGTCGSTPGEALVSGPAPGRAVADRTAPSPASRSTRPEVHNAFNASLIAELRTTFAGLAREAPTELRAVVLAGDGPSFCAGADIDWMRAAMALDVEGNEQDAMAMADMFETIDTCPVPVVARVQGGGPRRRDGPVRGRRPRHRRGRDASSGSPRRASGSCRR